MRLYIKGAAKNILPHLFYNNKYVGLIIAIEQCWF